MNRTKIIAVLVLVAAVIFAACKLFAQGFGSFSRDQPFLAANAAASGFDGTLESIAGTVVGGVLKNIPWWFWIAAVTRQLLLASTPCGSGPKNFLN